MKNIFLTVSVLIHNLCVISDQYYTIRALRYEIIYPLNLPKGKLCVLKNYSINLLATIFQWNIYFSTTKNVGRVIGTEKNALAYYSSIKIYI